ncbi:MAG: hypothetical protein RL141_279 [Candidatus Parcubacteria bacterium]
MKNDYTALHAEALKQTFIERQELRKQVEQWWKKRGWIAPAFLRQYDTPIGCLLRQVATARYEDCAFKLLAEYAGLKPVWLELTRDRFITGSDAKRSLVLRRVAHDSDHQIRTKRERLIGDISSVNGQQIREITLSDGRALTSFHHDVQDTILPGPVERHDLSALYEQLGLLSPHAYYPFVLSWFIAHAVMFEDFHGGESGAKLDGFTAKVVEPAWEEIVRVFGVPPLIIKLPWWTELGFYPANTNWRTHRALKNTHLLSDC